MNQGLKLLYLLVLKWSQSYLSGELSNSSGTLVLYSAEGTKIAFQVYLLLEYVGGPEKDQVFVAGQEISKFSLHIFFLVIVHLLA